MRIDCTLNILLLDDELLILLDLEYAVETAGHQCVAVTDVASALNAIEINEIDAAILDITLAPGVDSIPVAQALRVRHIPFVFHSGNLGPLPQEVTDFGAVVMNKPTLSSEVVRAAIESAAR